MLSCNADPALFSPPDATWTLLGNNSNNLAGMGLGVYGHVCTAAEPANYTCTLTGAPSLFSGQMYLCSGVQSPGYLDQIAFINPQVANANFNFPAVTNTAAGDLLIMGVGDFILGEAWSVPAGFTIINPQVTNVVTSYQAWWRSAAIGTVGPFAGQAAHTVVQDTFTLTLKPNVTATAPAQNLSAPIMTQSPVGPGLLNLQFSSNPLGLSGVTKFLPPVSNYRWSREAPIAIIGPGLNFNVAGITPENAAWCDLTWLALRA